ncbi:hypothetical protein [Croceicoccus naphthovorans]|uniref:Uncharacterized protein n=2 Tax=Croceicoccus naphthovorans TaxID=1348774 RepID=A0A0G3XGZ8_9SPHN|nr:hypothetical protein [Croceicoccus naphthovorans]AKM09894.1 hypothetical protein AB433_07690 [Croceicoccus naphthovorans]
MGRISLDSISDFARRGYDVKVTCMACRNVTVWNALQLMLELHKRRRSLQVDAAERSMVCRNCGAKDAAIMPVETSI